MKIRSSKINIEFVLPSYRVEMVKAETAKFQITLRFCFKSPNQRDIPKDKFYQKRYLYLRCLKVHINILYSEIGGRICYV